MAVGDKRKVAGSDEATPGCAGCCASSPRQRLERCALNYKFEFVSIRKGYEKSILAPAYKMLNIVWARVEEIFGSVRAHHGYLFANARGKRVKLVVHDGFGVCC